MVQLWHGGKCRTVGVVGPHGPTKYEDIQNSGYKVTVINEYILLFRPLWSRSGVEPNVVHPRRRNPVSYTHLTLPTILRV